MCVFRFCLILFYFLTSVPRILRFTTHFYVILIKNHIFREQNYSLVFFIDQDLVTSLNKDSFIQDYHNIFLKSLPSV